MSSVEALELPTNTTSTTNTTETIVLEENPETKLFNGLNTGLTGIFVFILVALPIFIAIFYPINFKRMDEDDFKQKYGEVYGGMHPNRIECILHPIFFLLRRYIFVITICIPIFSDKSWLQIEFQLILTMISLLFLLHFNMYLESLVEHLEIFNEVTTMILLYHLLGFTEFIGDVHA